jgi:hypothetical protein
MFKNRYLIGVGFLLILMGSLSISSFRNPSSRANRNAAGNDPVQTLNWTWTVAPSGVRTVASDYYAHHPELSGSNGRVVADTSLRNPYWTWAVAPSNVRTVASDYYIRHPELFVENGNPNWTWTVAPSAVTIITSDY